VIIKSPAHKVRKLYSKIFPNQLIVDDSHQRLTCLTFDDGPHCSNTEKIIEILNEHNIKCTFFLSGNAIEQNPVQVRLLHDNGHQLANHGYYHSKASDIGVTKYVQGVERVQNLLCDISGVEIKKVFRPPYGEMNLFAFYKLILKGYQYVLWSYDSCDSYMDTSSDIIDYLNKVKPRKSEIILAHEDYPQTVEILPQILQLLTNANHKLVTINQLVNKN